MQKNLKLSRVASRRFLCVSILIIGISIYSIVSVYSTTDSYKQVFYSSLTPHDSIFITVNYDLEVFPGSGTEEDPYLIEGYNITTKDNCGIHIRWTTRHFIIRNCYVDAADVGIYIGYIADGSATVINNTCNNNSHGIGLCSSYNSTIANNTCNNNNVCGIELRDSDYSTVINNTCSNNLWGILIEDSVSTTVANNTCNNNAKYGILIEDSDSSTVANNTCNNNNVGIRLSSSDGSTAANNMCENNNWRGISLCTSDSSTVINNICSNTNYNGIYISYSEFCDITYNHLQENEEYGICLGFYADNNSIHHNNLIDNNIGGTSQARDDEANNFWYDSATKEGNYWSDWSGTGSYSIDGSADSVDLYPLDEPAEYSTVETQVFFTFTLLIAVVPLILTMIISRKKDKRIK